MCINSTESWPVVGKSGKFLIFTNIQYIQNGHSVLLFFFQSKKEWLFLMYICFVTIKTLPLLLTKKIYG